MSYYRKKLGREMAELRVEADYSQHELAKVLKLTNNQFISNVERGLCFPSLKSLKAWCEAIGMRPEHAVSVIIDEFEQRIRKRAKL